MAAIRLEDERDSIENTLTVALGDGKSGASTKKGTESLDPLASGNWNEVTCLVDNMVCLGSYLQEEKQDYSSYGQSDFIEFLQYEYFL